MCPTEFATMIKMCFCSACEFIALSFPRSYYQVSACDISTVVSTVTAMLRVSDMDLLAQLRLRKQPHNVIPAGRNMQKNYKLSQHTRILTLPRHSNGFNPMKALMRGMSLPLSCASAPIRGQQAYHQVFPIGKGRGRDSVCRKCKQSRSACRDRMRLNSKQRRRMPYMEAVWRVLDTQTSRPCRAT